MFQQDCKPNSVLCDYLSVHNITTGIKRTTFNRILRRNPIICFVLAPNKDLAVSFLHCCKSIPQGDARLFSLSRFCSHLASYDGRPLAAIILSDGHFSSRRMVFGLSSLSALHGRAITHLAETPLQYQLFYNMSIETKNREYLGTTSSTSPHKNPY